jgi:NAD-dependent dihydropyrimidine dehydrogenase PreA subunit
MASSIAATTKEHSSLLMSDKKYILICQCAERNLVDIDEVSRHVPPSQRILIPDLCKAAQEKDPIFETVFSEIHACHPRAVRALFNFTAHPLSEETLLINHRKSDRSAATASADPAWYPVLDPNRCTHCGQCLEFCLFGVFEKTSKGKIVVTHPQNCKNNCPACARICPETAIIFPKVGETPINGAELPDGETLAANLKVNVDEILGDDIYAALNARKQKRRSLLNQKKLEKALTERQQCQEKS